MASKRTETRRFTAEQLEGLIRYEHDAGNRGLSLDNVDTESRIEMEAYVAPREVKPATAPAA